MENNDYIAFIKNKLKQVKLWIVQEANEEKGDYLVNTSNNEEIYLAYYQNRFHQAYQFSLYAPEPVLEEWKAAFHSTFNYDMDKEELFLFFWVS